MDAKSIRELSKRNDDIRDAGLTTPENVVRFDNIPYGPDPLQVLDVYRPKNENGKLPVIVSVHGGAWVYGDKERYQYYCMSLVRHGFAVVNFSYRLAPEAKWPAQLEDVNAAFSFVQDQAEKYGFDKDRVFGVGDSAGGHLLSLYSAFCTNDEYAAKFAFQPPKGFAPTAIALNCGIYSLEDRKEDSRMADLFDTATMEKKMMVSTYHFVTEKYPPVFLMTCTGDFLAHQPAILMPVLMENKIPFEFHFYSDGEQDLGHVFHCNMYLPIAHRCNQEECAFFRRYLT